MEPDKSRPLLSPFSDEILGQRIKEVLLSSHTCPHEMIVHITSRNGKLIRPRLVYLSASFVESDPDRVDMAWQWSLFIWPAGPR